MPPKSGNTSIYETIREHEEAHTASNHEGHDDDIDERNLGEHFRDQDVEDALAEAAESQTTTESTAFLSQQQKKDTSAKKERSRPRWARWSQGQTSRPKDEDDVPQSLLFEDGRDESRSPDIRRQRPMRETLPEPVPGPSNRNTRIQWDTTQAQQQLWGEGETPTRRGGEAPAAMSASGYYNASPEDKSMWRWANVENLDNFLTEVYDYYTQKGIWSITLAKALRLAQWAFIVCSGIFLRYCVDFSLIPKSKHLSEISIPGCTTRMGAFASALLWVFILWWILTAARLVVDFPRLRNLHDFYQHLLHVSDEELQTISWPEIVGRLMSLRDDNPRTALKISPKSRKFVGDNSRDRMDAIDIANRIMRRENYLIALFNKDVFDMTLPIPFLRNRQLYSKNLEWNIEQIILGHFFNDQGQVYQYFLKPNDRKKLISALQERFLFYGCMNLIQAPFLITYYLVVYFFRYFKEFQRDPSQLGSRAYTPMAEWKFREFNELYHFFRRRADMSFPFASRYLDQFPKDKTVQISSFVAFVTGALLAILAVASLLDPSNFLNFELTSERTVLFYLGVLTVIWTVCRGIVPDENQVFDPEFAIQEVINYTHYCPSHWKGRLHSDEVRKEFSSLYQMRVLIFLEELASFIFTPLVLWYSLPKCADRIVDFFREFTVHVDGLGYVCWFAQFEFNRPGAGTATTTTGKQPADSAEDDPRKDYYASKDNKMLASYYNFIDHYGPNPRKGTHGPARPRFHPPPAFPGLSSPPTAVSSAQAPAARKSQQPLNAPTRPLQRSQTEPSQSLLLDPHHQPPSSTSRRAHRRQPQDPPLEEAAEDEEVPPPPMTETTMMEEDSNLGDSWKTTRAAASAEDEHESAEGDNGNGAGVLGLLYQFQKAQTEGRGGGVGVGL